MKKTDLLKMRVEGGAVIYLGRQGKKVFVWGENGEEVEVAKLPVYNRKFIKQKLESIPLIQGEIDASCFEGCEGGITGQGDDDQSGGGDDQSGGDDQGNDLSDDQSKDLSDDQSGDDDQGGSDETETETKEGGEESQTDGQAPEADKAPEATPEETKATEKTEAPLPTKLKDLKTMAEKLKVEAQEATGKEIKVEIQSLRAKVDVIAKIDALKKVISEAKAK